MYKESTYAQKMELLNEWMESIFEEVKKDVKTHHLKEDHLFLKQNFPGKNLRDLTVAEMVPVYNNVFASGEVGERAGEFIAHRWMLKHTEIFDQFVRELTQINPDYSAIEEINPGKAEEIIERAVSVFGAPKTYIFAVMNSVVFPASAFENLRKLAQTQQKVLKENAVEEAEKKGVDDLKRHYETQISRLTDKYEKKLSGMQKKWETDVSALKKQVSTLQRKLNGTP